MKRAAIYGVNALLPATGVVCGGLIALAAIELTGPLTLPSSLMALACVMLAAAATLLFSWSNASTQNARYEQLRESVWQLQATLGSGDAESPVYGDTVTSLESQVRAANRAARSLLVEQEQTRALLTEQTQKRADFFGKLSHELRSPLNAILGYSAILLDEPDPDAETTRGDLRRIRQAGQNLLNLIDDLLDQSSDEFGRFAPEHAPFDLNALVERIAAQGTSRTIPVTTPSDLRRTQQTVFGNRDRIGRALSGVLERCRRLSPDGQVRIEVSPCQQANGQAQIRFIVWPVAPGSDEQPDAEWQNTTDGLFASVRATFTGSRPAPHIFQYDFAIPTDNRNKAAPTMIASVDTPVKSNDDGPRLALVIDDDPAAIDLLSRWVGRCGYRVVTAADGAEGLEKAREMLPDIVLLDALMPGKSGYEVLPVLRELPGMQCVPILMVTVDDDRNRGLCVGATDVVRKPVTEAQLRSLIAIYEEPRSGDILIVDDDQDALEILDRTIRRLGFTPRRATNGEEGLRAIEETRPKAILLDLNMPKVNGFEFIEALSSNPNLAGIPLIVVSGAELSAPQHSKLIEAGARYFLKGSAAPREIAEGLWEAVA